MRAVLSRGKKFKPNGYVVMVSGARVPVYVDLCGENIFGDLPLYSRLNFYAGGTDFWINPEGKVFFKGELNRNIKRFEWIREESELCQEEPLGV